MISYDKVCFRYATRRSRNCENDAARETSDDVQRYVAKGFTSGLQKIHARCKIFWCKQQHTHIHLYTIRFDGMSSEYQLVAVGYVNLAAVH